MRLAILTCVYPPYGGGIGDTAYHNAAELARGATVTVFTPRYPGRPAPAAAPGVVVEALTPWGRYGNAAFLPQLVSRLRGFEAVHLHYPFFGAQELLRFLPPRLKLVLTYHMVAEGSGLAGLVMNASARSTERFLARRASLLISQTADYLKQVALPRLGQPAKWHIVPPGVDGHYTPGEPPAELQQKLKLAPGTPTVLFVGSLDSAHAFKGVPVLLEAVANLRTPNWRLLVVGDGNLRPQYEARARELGLAPRVTWCGYVAEAELPDYFRAASVVALPSTSGAETFGLVLLQAMACAKPVVASALPGVREVVRAGETGRLAAPGDAPELAVKLDELLAAPSLARTMGERGHALVEQHYRWTVVGQRLRQLYHTYVV